MKCHQTQTLYSNLILIWRWVFVVFVVRYKFFSRKKCVDVLPKTEMQEIGASLIGQVPKVIASVGLLYVHQREFAIVAPHDSITILLLLMTILLLLITILLLMIISFILMIITSYDHFIYSLLVNESICGMSECIKFTCI